MWDAGSFVELKKLLKHQTNFPHQIQYKTVEFLRFFLLINENHRLYQFWMKDSRYRTIVGGFFDESFLFI